MVKLLIIADDFTGALDTGVQFAKKGIETQIVAQSNICDIQISQTAQVLVVDSETRPLKAEEAYKGVYRLVQWAIENNISTVYKKTDSALRGNVGAELKAVTDAAEQPVYFIPAYPAINRVTLRGIHFIDGVSLEKSEFGKDPFEPVKSSDVSEILQSNAQVEVENISLGETPGEMTVGKKVVVFDAKSDSDIFERICWLKAENKLRFLAGCAGFATFLPEAMGFQGGAHCDYHKTDGLYVACGSLNPITKRQIEYAQTRGFLRINLKSHQKLNPGYYDTSEGREFLDKIHKITREHKKVIVDTFDLDGDDALSYASEQEIAKEDIRYLVTQCHSRIMNYLVEKGLNNTFFMTGGDTLMGFMKTIYRAQLTPVSELSQGTVLSQLKWENHQLQVVSKSGGFGKEDVLVKLAEKLVQREEEHEICNDASGM